MEREAVKHAFKNGGWGFRAPGSGTFTRVDGTSTRSVHHERSLIHVQGTLPATFKDNNYLTVDYVAWEPSWGEIRVVEAKSVSKRAAGARYTGGITWMNQMVK